MASEFDGKTVIVAGGGSGIGRASAKWFRSRGSHVFVGDIDRLAEVESEYANLGISSQRCDVRVDSEVTRLVEEAVISTDRIDVLVYSAGVEATGQVPEVSEDRWDKCMDTNVKGAFLFARRVLPIMASRGGGAIVHVASNAGLLPRAHDPVYSVSKAAIVAWTKALALCHAKERIRVNAVCPGPVEGTRMMDKDLAIGGDPAERKRQIIAACPMAQAAGRMATAEEIAEAIGYLASPSAVFVTGAILAIDGAKSLGVPPYYGPTIA